MRFNSKIRSGYIERFMGLDFIFMYGLSNIGHDDDDDAADDYDIPCFTTITINKPTPKEMFFSVRNYRNIKVKKKRRACTTTNP